MDILELVHVLSVDRYLHPHIGRLRPFVVIGGHRNSIRSGIVSSFDKGLLDQCGLIFSQPSLYGLLLDRAEAKTSADDERVEHVAQG